MIIWSWVTYLADVKVTYHSLPVSLLVCCFVLNVILPCLSVHQEIWQQRQWDQQWDWNGRSVGKCTLSLFCVSRLWFVDLSSLVVNTSTVMWPSRLFFLLFQFDELSLASNPESPQPLELEPVRQRRTRIPDKPNYYLNLWSIMKNCIGKELSKIPMPVRNLFSCWYPSGFSLWEESEIVKLPLSLSVILYPLGEFQRAPLNAATSVWRPGVLRAAG